MMDFLKAYPNVSRHEYLWEWTIPQIVIAMHDATRIDYSKKKYPNKPKVKGNSGKGNTIKINSIDDIKNNFLK